MKEKKEWMIDKQTEQAGYLKNKKRERKEKNAKLN